MRCILMIMILQLAMSAQHMKKAEKLMELGLCRSIAARIVRSQKHVDDNEVNGAAWGKSLELLYQYETLQ